nr:MAG TPA: hypothetical protein [Caudoviricetes sp.]
MGPGGREFESHHSDGSIFNSSVHRYVTDYHISEGMRWCGRTRRRSPPKYCLWSGCVNSRVHSFGVRFPTIHRPR